LFTDEEALELAGQPVRLGNGESKVV
jgi:hypothetical protein